MSNEFILSMKSIGLSTREGRKPTTLLRAAEHNKRTHGEELDERGKIDGSRSHLNYCIAGASDVAEVVARALALMKETGTTPDKLRKDYCQAIEIMCSLPVNTTIDTTLYFARCVEWIGERFGADNILCADVHLDQKQPHCHVLLVPIESGQWVGGKLLLKERTAQHWQGFGADIARPFGLSMGGKLAGSRKAEAVAMVLEAFASRHPALLLDVLWQPTRKAVERDPAPFLNAEGLDAPKVKPVKLRTVAEIFTSKGKGPKRESKPDTSRSETYGFATPKTFSAQESETYGLPAPAKIGAKNVDTYPVGIAPIQPAVHSRPKQFIKARSTARLSDQRDASEWTPEHDGQGFPDDEGQRHPDDGDARGRRSPTYARGSSKNRRKQLRDFPDADSLSAE